MATVLFNLSQSYLDYDRYILANNSISVTQLFTCSLKLLLKLP